MTWALDQTALEAFLVPVFFVERSSADDLDIGWAHGSFALVGEQEKAVDTKPLEVQDMDEIHEAAPEVEVGQARLLDWPLLTQQLARDCLPSLISTVGSPWLDSFESSTGWFQPSLPLDIFVVLPW